MYTRDEGHSKHRARLSLGVLGMMCWQSKAERMWPELGKAETLLEESGRSSECCSDVCKSTEMLVISCCIIIIVCLGSYVNYNLVIYRYMVGD